MMEADFALAIPRGLDQSILLTVLLGLVVMLVLAESFGWVFVGVVVPGYLGSIMVIQPAAGMAVLMDAVMTFVIARGLAGILSRFGATTEFFGRERFFLIVLVSVLVRQHSQSWILPLSFGSIEHIFPFSTEFSDELYSLGLVLVPLTANILWKLELRRGLFQVLIALTLTYFLLTHWLLPYTNLSYGALELTYENAAIDFMGNAKGYIIMLSTAFVAAHFNVKYGWDYNGILVPSLLALLWLSPSKLGTSLAESLVLLMLVRGLLGFPGIRTLNFEGPRKLALVFGVGIGLKWLIGGVVGPYFPDLKVTDLYGFGYLLPSLLAIKMLQIRSAKRVLLPTVWTSLVGFIGGSLIGFGLDLAFPQSPSVTRGDPQQKPTRLLRSPHGVAAFARLRALREPSAPPNHGELVAHSRAWHAIDAWVADPGPDGRRRAQAAATRAGLSIHAIDHGVGMWPAFAVLELASSTHGLRGWNTAIVVPGAPGPIIEVPHPATEAPSSEVAVQLCLQLRCRAVSFSFESRGSNRGGSPMPRRELDRMASAPVLVLRSDGSVPSDRPILHAHHGLPSSIGIADLWPEGTLDLTWSPPPPDYAARGRDVTLVLRVHPDALRARIGRNTRVAAYSSLEPWLRNRIRTNVEVRKAAEYIPPTREELLYLERLLVGPLLRSSSTDATALRTSAYAEWLGFEIVEFQQCGGGDSCIVAQDITANPEAGWGAIVVRRGRSEAVAIEVPRPRFHPGSSQLGLELWKQTRARALVLAGADHGTGSEPPDPLARGNSRTPFQAFHQAVDRSLGAHDSGLILQVAGLSEHRGLQTDVVIGLGHPLLQEDQIPERLADELTRGGTLSGWNHRFSDGSLDVHDLSGSGIPQLEYSSRLGHTDAAILWFSPGVRSTYLARRHRGERLRLEALGRDLPVQDEVEKLLNGLGPVEQIDPPSAPAPLQGALSKTEAYATTRNVHLLRSVLRDASHDPDLEVHIGLGRRTGRPFAWLEHDARGVVHRALILLGPDTDSERLTLQVAPSIRKRVTEAISFRHRTTMVIGHRKEGG